MPARLRAEKTPWLLLLVFILLSAGIAAVGLSYYNAEKATHLEDQRSQLAAVADLKVGQIVAWRLERLGDASIMRQSALVNAQVQEFLASGAGAPHRREIQAWLDSLLQAYDYGEAVLVAPDGSVRLASPPTAAWIGPIGQAMVDEVLQTGEPAFSDLHRAGPDNRAHLDLVIPLQVEPEGASSVIGVLILRIDPSIYLFPLVQSWPTSSPSAETVLVRREGDQVLFLNEQRHASDPALTLSFPITRSDLPAAMAVQGVEGIVEGNDYRGVPVMAVLRPVPNTSWFMVAKVDSEEILAPVVRQGQLVGGIVVILVLVAGVSTALLWRVQRAEFGRKQSEAELERKVLTEHFGYLGKYANDAIVLADREGRIVEANERAEAVYGCSRDALLRMYVRDLLSAEERAEYPEDMRQVEEHNGMVFETVHMRKDGTTFPVEVSARFIEVEGQRYHQSIIRDITERKRAEKALQESEARYRRLHESMTDCYVQTTMLGSIVDVNRSYLAMLGYSEGEVSSLRYQDLTPARWHAFEQQIVETQIMPWGYSDVYEKEYIRKDGTVFPVELRTYLLRDTQGQPSGMWAIVRDITERKRAEEALASSEQFLSNVIEQSPVSMWISDSEGTLIRMNQACRELFGVTDEEAVGKYNILKDNVIEEQGLMPLVGNVFEKGNTARFTLDYDLPRVEHIEVKEGTHTILDVSVSPIKDIHGKLTNALVQHKDITERKRAEEALTTSEVRYRRLFEAARDGILILDADTGMVVDVNPFLVEMLGYSREQFLGKKIWELGVFKDIAANRANFLELQQKEYVTFENLPLETAKGRLIDVEFVSHVYQVYRHKVIQCNIRDITARKREEENLRRFATVVRDSNDAITIQDFEGRITAWNHGAELMYGYGEKEALLENIERLTAPGKVEEQKDFTRRLVAGEAITSFETQRVTKDGRVLDIWLTVTKLVDDAGRSIGIASTERDITERKRAEAGILAAQAELQRLLAEADQAHLALLRVVEDRKTAEEEVRRLNAELEQRVRDRTAQLEAANQELEAFSYSVSHDLRAPLRAIDGFSRIVLDEHAPALAPEAQRYLHLVQDNTQQMGRLVDDLLAFSHLSRQPMAKQLVDPADLVHAALQDLHAEQAGRQIDLVIRDLPTCQADPALLKQVWVNLLSNALKFTRPRERAVIEVGAYEEGSHPVYCVKDNGVGFDMQYVGKLFGVFQRLHRSEDYEGTGVGLAIVQRIVHRHGGRVWAEAKVDQGATFWFTLEGGIGNDEGHRGDPAGRGQSE